MLGWLGARLLGLALSGPTGLESILSQTMQGAEILIRPIETILAKGKKDCVYPVAILAQGLKLR